METVLLVIIGCAAVWYLCRYIVRVLSAGASGCGCATCRDCPLAQKQEEQEKCQ
jgi:hypothetical protein